MRLLGAWVFALGTVLWGCGSDSFNIGDAAVTDDVTVCVPKSCAELGAQCDNVNDGCGHVLACGSCTQAQTACTDNKCTCKGKSCTDLGANCGNVPDGCDNILSCGTCEAPTPYCGGGGPNKCGAAPCTPKSCTDQGLDCGKASDRCGTVLDCGVCTPPKTCGGTGQVNVCGCKAKDCAGVSPSCGPGIDDGCGSTITCSCGSADLCNGLLKKCCKDTCKASSWTCGTTTDGCGSDEKCGPDPTLQSSSTKCSGTLFPIHWSCGSLSGPNPPLPKLTCVPYQSSPPYHDWCCKSTLVSIDASAEEL